jgi:hypothetical protein
VRPPAAEPARPKEARRPAAKPSAGSIADALGSSGGLRAGSGTLGGTRGAGGGAGLGHSAQPAPEWPDLQGIPVPTTRKFLGPPPAALKTLGDIARHIASTLEQHGYEEVGYFRYTDGFAIATRPERIGGDAKPALDRRWPAARIRKGAPMQSLHDLFEVNGEDGDRYRSFLFLCMSTASDVDFQGGSEQSWGLWKTGSSNPEGDVLLARPAAGHKLYAFIYELSQGKDGHVLIATSSPNTAAEHLRGAGLIAFLR